MVKVTFPGSNPPPAATRREEGLHPRCCPTRRGCPTHEARSGRPSRCAARARGPSTRAGSPHRRLDSPSRRRLGRRAAAGLLEVLKSAGGFRAESTLERWAHRIVVRQVMRVAARARRAASVSTSMPSSMSSPLRFPSPRPPTTCRSRFSSPRATARAAAQRARAPCHSLDHSIQEIADALGLAQSQVKKRLLRANHLMRRMIRRDRVIGVHVRKGTHEPPRLRALASLFDRRSVDDALSEDEMAFSRQHEASCAECRV